MFPVLALAGENIEISVFRNTPVLRLEGVDVTVLDGTTRRPLAGKQGYGVHVFEASAGGLVLNQRPIDRRAAEVTSKSNFIEANGRRYRGAFKVIAGEGDRLLAVNVLDLEDYLIGLINHEVSSDWPLEAVKAQAVVARTYAVYQKQRVRHAHYDLDSTVLDQVYGGSDSEDERARLAVQITRGLILTHDGGPIQAFYHSTCGGRTEGAQHVWGQAFPYASGVPCAFCSRSPSYRWELWLTAEEIERKLVKDGLIRGSFRDMRVYRNSPSGRASVVRVDTDLGRYDINANRFRQAMGFGRLKSTFFVVDRRSGGYAIRGGGLGHGVGMCQWGAKGMAEKGYNYPEILRHYFPGAEIRRLYP